VVLHVQLPHSQVRLQNGNVFSFFFWVLLQVSFVVLHVQLPHSQVRLQNGNVFAFFFWVIL